MDISMDIHGKSVDMDMDGKFHIHGKPGNNLCVGLIRTTSPRIFRDSTPIENSKLKSYNIKRNNNITQKCKTNASKINEIFNIN